MQSAAQIKSKRAAEATAKRREGYRAAGFCFRCGATKGPDRTSCARCIVMVNKNRRLRQEEGRTTVHRRWEKGLCKCGRLPFQGKKHCEPCLIKARRFHLKRLYGKFDVDDLVKRFPVCAICGTKGDLGVDHNHSNGKARGRLCRPCNTGLGAFKDNPALLVGAIQYLAAGETEKECKK